MKSTRPQTPPPPTDGGNGDSLLSMMVKQTSDVWFIPATYAFSIWGVISLFVTAFIVYQWIPGTFVNSGTGYFARAQYLIVHQVSYYFLLSSVFNMSWLTVWNNNELNGSLIVIILLATSVGHMYFRTNPKNPVSLSTLGYNATHSSDEQRPLLTTPAAAVEETESWLTYLCVRAPWGLYFGWLLCADSVNFFIVFLRIDDATPLATLPYAIAAVIVVFLVGFHLLLTFQEPLAPLVISWALSSIPYNRTIKHFPDVHDSFEVCVYIWVSRIASVLLGAGVLAFWIVKGREVLRRRRENVIVVAAGAVVV
ncbi:hypothetical protein HDU76_011153 [Blyttiomyces sp. JEL0837]|nr:hypothetical protein HDU76_011153 [Blyttiomyces sp. JEL0837]